MKIIKSCLSFFIALFLIAFFFIPAAQAYNSDFYLGLPDCKAVVDERGVTVIEQGADRHAPEPYYHFSITRDKLLKPLDPKYYTNVVCYTDKTSAVVKLHDADVCDGGDVVWWHYLLAYPNGVTPVKYPNKGAIVFYERSNQGDSDFENYSSIGYCIHRKKGVTTASIRHPIPNLLSNEYIVHEGIYDVVKHDYSVLHLIRRPWLGPPPDLKAGLFVHTAATTAGAKLYDEKGSEIQSMDWNPTGKNWYRVREPDTMQSTELPMQITVGINNTDNLFHKLAQGKYSCDVTLSALTAAKPTELVTPVHIPSGKFSLWEGNPQHTVIDDRTKIPLADSGAGLLVDFSCTNAQKQAISQKASLYYYQLAHFSIDPNGNT